MDCPGIASQLVAYHLGLLPDAEADVVDEHLVGCRACLKTYLAVKRGSDKAELDGPGPGVKARLRAEVARAFPPATAKPRPVAVLLRRIPLYQGVALAALAAAVALAAPSVLRRFSHTEGGSPSLVDTARTRAESLHIY
jgi:anti-sigma factor RsiW